ncbi:hypothetical protein B0H63DRAFT_112197 [Podospora didyma]|uniref:Uncharacterized protein n=1 Tax=Podospora didyma TaxID=330526 RepID=A0AAE0NYX3_9PEZI|nr:hypothetical protein B0H63DRAFT_112197 [Podospora didyma]
MAGQYANLHAPSRDRLCHPRPMFDGNLSYTTADAVEDLRVATSQDAIDTKHTSRSRVGQFRCQRHFSSDALQASRYNRQSLIDDTQQLDAYDRRLPEDRLLVPMRRHLYSTGLERHVLFGETTTKSTKMACDPITACPSNAPPSNLLSGVWALYELLCILLVLVYESTMVHDNCIADKLERAREPVHRAMLLGLNARQRDDKGTECQLGSQRAKAYPVWHLQDCGIEVKARKRVLHPPWSSE